MENKKKPVKAKKHVGQGKDRLKYYAVCYGFSLPYFLIFCIFTVCPVVISIFLGFTDFNMLEMPTLWEWTTTSACFWKTRYSSSP